MTSDWEAWVSTLRPGDIVWSMITTTFYDHPFTRAQSLPRGTPLLFLEYAGQSKNWLRVARSDGSIEIGIIRESDIGASPSA